MKKEPRTVTYEARLLPCSDVLNSLTGLNSAKRSGIQAQTTLISVFVTTLEVKLLKSTVSTDCLCKNRNTVRLFFLSHLYIMYSNHFWKHALEKYLFKFF